MSTDIYTEDRRSECEWCGSEVNDAEIQAVSPPGHTVMMCVYCVPDNPDWTVQAD